MKYNNWGIRDFFRYTTAILSSVTIILYMIWFIFVVFLTNLTTGINEDSISEVMVQYIWENKNLVNNKENDEIEYLDTEDKEFDDIMLAMTEITNEINKSFEDLDNNQDDINQSNEITTNLFLQNEDTLDIREIFSEDTKNEEKITLENKFDIEKIISNLHLQKEKRVAVVAKKLWVDRKKEKLDYAELAWIEWKYNWSLEQNEKIRNYLIANAQEIYKDKHWWNERENLPMVAKWKKTIKMNAQEITWQITYNDITLNVSAPVESFPEWTILKIKTLADDDSTTTFDLTLKEVILMTQVNNVEYNAPMASFDISFYASDDTEFIEELQPAEWKSVSVTFDYANNKEFKNSEDEWFLAIYHMEDNQETSVANLVGINENIKSDSMSIYANTLSVYILTVVSDLDEDLTGSNKTITFDAGNGFIINDENIVLSSIWTDIDATYTWIILSQNNEIILPNVKLASWYSFWWWYKGNSFLWNAWSIFKLWNSDNSTWNHSDLDVEIYACLSSEEFTWNICILDENEKLDLEKLVETLDTEDNPNIEVYTPSEEEIKKYGEEVFVAYNWAINNWITTIDDVSKVQFNKKITRAELAKMMVEFMSWTLKKQPIITWEVNYRDVNYKNLWDLGWYIQLAYQFQIMGINADWTPIEDFNPNKTVTRSEFATVLSRIMFGDKYNQDWENYYEKHIKALEKVNILGNTDPNLIEARWWIMIMLYKSKDIENK